MKTILIMTVALSLTSRANALESVSNRFWNTTAYVNPTPKSVPCLLESSVDTRWFSEGTGTLSYFSSWPVIGFLIFLR